MEVNVCKPKDLRIKKKVYSIAAKGHMVTITIMQTADTPYCSEWSALASRVSFCVRTLTKQQVISEQTDEVDTARLGVVGPRDHGYLLVRAESRWIRAGTIVSSLSIQEKKNYNLEFPTN